jgi:hypothetical protein
MFWTIVIAIHDGSRVCLRWDDLSDCSFISNHH